MQLVVQSGAEPGRTYDLTAGNKLSIGRQSSNQIVVGDEQVSRKHAEIELSPTGVLVVDLSSSNGTFVNGTRISSPIILKTGDTLQVGTTVLKLVDNQAALRTMPPGVYEAGDATQVANGLGGFGAGGFVPSTRSDPPAYNGSSTPDYGYNQPPQQAAASNYSAQPDYDQAPTPYGGQPIYGGPSAAATPYAQPGSYGQSQEQAASYGQPGYGQANQQAYAQPDQQAYGQQNYAQPDQQAYGQQNYAQPGQAGNNFAQPPGYGPQGYNPQQAYAQPGQVAAKPARKGNPIPIIIGAVVLLLVLAGLAFVFLSGGGGEIPAPNNSTKYEITGSDQLDLTKNAKSFKFSLYTSKDDVAALDTFYRDKMKAKGYTFDSTRSVTSGDQRVLVFTNGEKAAVIGMNKLTTETISQIEQESPSLKGKLTAGNSLVLLGDGKTADL